MRGKGANTRYVCESADSEPASWGGGGAARRRASSATRAQARHRRRPHQSFSKKPTTTDNPTRLVFQRVYTDVAARQAMAVETRLVCAQGVSPVRVPWLESYYWNVSRPKRAGIPQRPAAQLANDLRRDMTTTH